MADISKKILIIDDDESLRVLLKARLEANGYSVVAAGGGMEALALLRPEKPDLILLDIMMPDMGGEEVLRRMKGNREIPPIPVIFLTAKDTTVAGLELGAADYIQKPFNSEELIARIRVQLRIKQLQDELTELSHTDYLTGCYNRRYALAMLESEVKRTRRYHMPLSCVMMDIDGFKTLNDRHGHDFGDFVLKRVAGIISGVARGVDVVCRYGGDEFLLILPHTDETGARVLCRRLSERIAFESIASGDIREHVTVTLGIATDSDGKVDKAESLITLADRELYRAKRESGSARFPELSDHRGKLDHLGAED
ncbi:MAG: diguanylate cyclase [Candidatus Aureabacteria bacterium]|nr:diguanylate cyclase [Candidatus Auribacterota bacterium]